MDTEKVTDQIAAEAADKLLLQISGNGRIQTHVTDELRLRFINSHKSAIEKALKNTNDGWHRVFKAQEERHRAAHASESPPPTCSKCGYNVNLVDGICTHCGNPFGARPAHASEPWTRSGLSETQRELFLDIQACGESGCTVDEYSEARDVTPNSVSGRFTELRIKGKIEKRGTRKTRSGCSAAVWVAV